MMAVRAHRDIRVALRHLPAVNTLCVCGSHTLMTRGAGFRHRFSRLRRLLDVVRSVAVDANRRCAVATRDGLLVHAVERLGVVGEMALPALRVHGKRQIPSAGKRPLGMRDFIHGGVAVGAGHLGVH